ncbi:MAG TPA: PIN domain-containing protein [Spirochaetota bacterium]|nr:PIN domain-containing protein [Spirochaetota bacterium]HOS33690.1 PIN domain-containing protein [Spirochaetota bacterium]HOS54846.1 PIN domain-containing protein [Spirochaetota bacterium]HPK61954.1 PIN domain-containing protein [Spirochaetota bacterium]HQF76801.1 PIN domain-containing protein [Spirochaetota bacterium]
MPDKIFIDTNLLVYAYVEQDKEKHDKILDFFLSIRKNYCFVSVQVINEFYSALSKNKVPHNIIHNNIIEISNICNIADLDFEIVKLCLHIKEKYKLPYWDSLIVTTAIKNECAILYSEDLQHNLKIEKKLKIINPFINN